MAKWGSSLSASPPQDNHPKATLGKIGLRRWALDAIGPENARVLDLFAGSGAMYRAVWQEAGHYRGCDKVFFRDRRLCYVTDNLRLLRSIDLDGFNVFDLDAYGAPWKTATVLATRRRLVPGETIAVVLTDGAMRKSRLGAMESSLSALAGVPTKMPGVHRDWERVTRAALAEMADRMGATLADMRAVDQSGRMMYYSAALFTRAGRAQKKAPAAQDGCRGGRWGGIRAKFGRGWP